MVARQPVRCSVAAASNAIKSSFVRIPAATRCLHARVRIPSIPKPIPFCPDVQTFLTLIGRDLSQHASKIESWNALFTLTSDQLKGIGVEPARSRKYLLKWVNKYRYGEHGIGGDFKHVKDGRGYVRVCDVPADSEIARRVWIMKHGEGPKSDGMEPSAAKSDHASINTSPGTRKVILNIPVDWAKLDEALEDSAEEPASTPERAGNADAIEGAGGVQAAAPQASSPIADEVMRAMSAEDYELAVPVAGFRRRGNDRALSASYAKPIKGCRHQAVSLSVCEGLWEHKRGHKIDGGERRKAEVRYKRRTAERKAGAR